MFKTLRMKLMLGFPPLLAILIGLGLWAIAMFYGLGGNIDVILRENYHSVHMKSSNDVVFPGLDPRKGDLTWPLQRSPSGW